MNVLDIIRETSARGDDPLLVRIAAAAQRRRHPQRLHHDRSPARIRPRLHQRHLPPREHQGDAYPRRPHRVAPDAAASRHGGHLGRDPRPLRHRGGAAPDLRRPVALRHRGRAHRHGLPRAAQRAGAARRLRPQRTPFHAPSAGALPRHRPRAADRGDEPRRVRRRRSGGVPPLEILDRRGGLSKNTSTPSTPKATCATSKPRSTPAPTTS